MLHFLGEQRRTVEFEHLQRAVDLVHVGQAEAQARRVLTVVDERLQCLARLLERFGDFAFDPLRRAVSIPHSHAFTVIGFIAGSDPFGGQRFQVRVVATR